MTIYFPKYLPTYLYTYLPMSTLANNCKHFITETSEGVGIRQRRSDSEGRIREAPEGAQNHRPGKHLVQQPSAKSVDGVLWIWNRSYRRLRKEVRVDDNLWEF